MAITITCPNCQKVLRTNNPPPAGRKVKCPACTKPFLPEIDEAATAIQQQPTLRLPPKSQPDKESKPVSVRRQRVAEDDEDVDDDQPRKSSKKKPKKKGSMLPWILAGCGGLLCLSLIGGGIGVYFWFKGGTPGTNNNPMTFIPANANMIVGIDVGGMRERNQLQSVLDFLKQQPGQKPEDVQMFEQLFQDGSKAIIAVNTAEQQNPKEPILVMVLTTKEKVDQSKFIKLHAAESVPAVEGLQIYHTRPTNQQRREWLAFPGDHMIVLSSQPEAAFASLVKEAKKGVPRSDTIDLSRKADGGMLWIAFSPDAGARQQMMGPMAMLPNIPKEHMPAAEAAQKAKGGFLRVDWVAPGGMKMQLALSCENKDDAGKVKSSVDTLWQTKGKPTMQMAGLMGNLPIGGPQAPPIQIKNLVLDVVKSFTTNQDDKLVTVQLELSDATLRDMQQMPAMINNLNAMNQGMPPVPNRPNAPNRR